MMGSGKSIIGQNLSKKYKIDFYDTDKEIEKRPEQKFTISSKNMVKNTLGY